MTEQIAARDVWPRRLRDESQREAALAELREILVRGLKRAFGAQGGGESFSEDVAQEALLKILEKLDQFSGRSKFTTWAMSIAIRIGTSQFRRKRFQDVSINTGDRDDNLQMNWADEEAIPVERRQEQQAVLGLLQQLIENSLTDRQRQATEALMHGMPVEEIAARISSNRNAVYKLIHDARARLRQGLESAGYGADDILTAFA